MVGKRTKSKPKQKSVQSRIRDMKRSLARPGLPETIRQSQERTLIALEDEFKEQQKSKEERKMVKKYKMVRFFETRKISRKFCVLLKQYEEQSEQGADEKTLSATLDAMKPLAVDLRYISTFPKMQKYLSVLKPKEEMSENAIAQREKMLNTVASSLNLDTFIQQFKRSTFWASGPKDKDADELDAGEDDMDIHAAPLGEDDQSEDDNEAAAAGFQDDFLIAVSSKSNDGEQADVEVKAQDAKDEDEDDDDNDGEPTAKRRKRKRSRKKKSPA